MPKEGEEIVGKSNGVCLPIFQAFTLVDWPSRFSFQTRIPSRLCSPDREKTMEGEREKGRVAQKRKRSSEDEAFRNQPNTVCSIFHKEITPNRTYANERYRSYIFSFIYKFIYYLYWNLCENYWTRFEIKRTMNNLSVSHERSSFYLQLIYFVNTTINVKIIARDSWLNVNLRVNNIVLRFVCNW